ncbi:major facilitator superfamily domain-containing protein [Lasiosphaeria miniovina]|uniref:Major facilitator superfamily domain-containing protein n=1 Tax=Lasiosphaeria miniovina TaxID=1954250 RepID=A0AA40AKB4_9PEZI|nr:major facilitator superfamily domain-containing protein [Lasiosphaeria miniovina]KAK0717444.1 major facilitator superfamily domain-containing protein [Lasiosphaeria miniovina]
MAAEPKPTLVTAEGGTGDLSSDSVDDDPIPRLHAKTFLAVFSVCLIYMSQLVCLVGAGAQGQVIAGHFGGTAQTVWFSAPITIMTVVLGPIVAQAADYWGRKWFLVSLTLVGAVGTVVVARASSMNMAIGGFCVIGLAFGAQPLLHVVTSEVLPRRWRAWGQAADMISNAVGSSLGLYVGGALNRTSDPASDGFRYYFYMAMACFVSAAAMCALVYSPPPLPTQTQFTNAEKLAKLDWVGYFFLATGLVLFSVGLSYSKNPYEWTDPAVSATFALGLAFVAGLVVYATRFKTDGMFHHGLFTGNRNFSIAAFCVFAEGVAFFAANTYFAFQVSVLYEHDALLVGVRYSTMTITSAIAACLTAWYCARARRVRWVTVLAFSIFVACFAALANTSRDSDRPMWGYPVLLGTALGMTLTTLVTAAQLSTPPELISIASGILISVRSLGGTVGLAIYNALFNEAMGHLGSNVADAVLADGLAPENVGPFLDALGSQNATALSAIPGVTPETVERGAAALQDTYVTAFRHVWIAGGCFVALAAVVAGFLFDPRKEFNMHIDAPVEKDEDMYSV